MENSIGSRRRGAGNARRRRVSRVPERQLRNVIRFEADGRMFTPQRTPPRITDVPWNSIVVTRTDTTNSTTTTPVAYTMHDVYLFLNEQLGQANNGLFSMEFRFTRVESWNLGDNASIIMDVFPLQTLTTLTSVMARLEDQPGRNQWACVGYEWPRSHRNYVFQDTGAAAPTGNPQICRVFSDVAASRIWVRWHMLWRYTVTLPPSLMRALTLDDDSFVEFPTAHSQRSF
jgi:hypothetical protein